MPRTQHMIQVRSEIAWAAGDAPPRLGARLATLVRISSSDTIWVREIDWSGHYDIHQVGESDRMRRAHGAHGPMLMNAVVVTSRDADLVAEPLSPAARLGSGLLHLESQIAELCGPSHVESPPLSPGAAWLSLLVDQFHWLDVPTDDVPRVDEFSAVWNAHVYFDVEATGPTLREHIAAAGAATSPVDFGVVVILDT